MQTIAAQKGISLEERHGANDWVYSYTIVVAHKIHEDMMIVHDQGVHRTAGLSRQFSLLLFLGSQDPCPLRTGSCSLRASKLDHC